MDHLDVSSAGVVDASLSFMTNMHTGRNPHTNMAIHMCTYAHFLSEDLVMETSCAYTFIKTDNDCIDCHVEYFCAWAGLTTHNAFYALACQLCTLKCKSGTICHIGHLHCHYIFRELVIFSNDLFFLL